MEDLRIGILGRGNKGGNHNRLYGRRVGGTVTAAADIAARTEEAARPTGDAEATRT